MQALEDIFVVELDCGLAGAMAGMLLCDNGARVLKVEPPTGARERGQPGHRVWNRGKHSVVLDLRQPADIAALQDYLTSADVLIDHEWPDGASTVALGIESLSAAHPRLVACGITGYGSKGPLSGLPANDTLIATRFGLSSSQPGWGPGPAYIAHPIASLGAALLAAQGIAAALLAREHTGRGQAIRTSLLGGLYAMTTYTAGEQIRKARSRWKPLGSSPFYSMYECADGRWLQLGCIHRGFARKALEAIGLADVLRDSRFHEGFGLEPGAVEDELFARVTGVMRTKPLAEWALLLEAADVPFAPVQEGEAFLDDPQGRVNGFAHVADPEVGPMEQMGLPIRLGATPGAVKGPAPRLGQHPVLRTDRQAPKGNPVAAPWPADQPPPLQGIRVLELANVIAGPLAARFLADLGAEVIKLEPPDGGDIARRNGSPAFFPLNSGKKGIAVDLRQPAGQAIGLELAQRADVLIDNMRPGVAERLGLGWPQLQRLNPRLVYCHVTGFGSRGPHAHKPGLDPLAGALTGVQWLQGAYAGKPVFVLVAAVDHTTALLASNAILLGLLARERTGTGQRVETCLLDGAALIGSQALTRYADKPPRADLPRTQYGLHALHRLYAAADGWLCVTIDAHEQWTSLCHALGRADLLSDPRFRDAASRLAHDEALAAILAASFRTRRVGEWIAGLEALRVPCAPLAEDFANQFVHDEQSRANGLIVAHDHPALGRIQHAHGWLQFSASPSRCTMPTPLLGQHTREVLLELGYPADAIEALRQQGAIHCAEAA